MTSGEYITYFLILSVLGIFPVWEFVQLYRRRQGNKSALTASQYVTRKALAGHKGWKWFCIIFPIFILLVALWLTWHWYSWCFAFGLGCKVDL